MSAYIHSFLTLLAPHRCHPELNPVELCWARGKWEKRRRQETGRPDEHMALVKLCFSQELLPKDLIRQFFARVRRYLYAYALGMEMGGAMKLQAMSCHRRPRDKDLSSLLQQLRELGISQEQLEELRNLCWCSDCISKGRESASLP